ncbi:MAG: hypothetical protein KGQ80_04975, partial [Bacteroidetes bacterium]|nr:hypothetical protein [Bacteroidota bacterium]
MDKFYRFSFIFCIGSVVFSFRASAQMQVDALADRLRLHVYALSDDSMAGRQTGSAEEHKAAQHIIGAFSELKLRPAGERPKTGGTAAEGVGAAAQGVGAIASEGWKQGFTFTARKEFAPLQTLRIRKSVLVWGKDWHTLPESGNGSIKGSLQDVGYGISAPDLGHDDYAGQPNLAGKIALIRVNSPDGNNP